LGGRHGSSRLGAGHPLSLHLLLDPAALLGASVPMLPVVVSLARTVRTMGAYTLVVCACSFALIPVADMGVIYGIAAVVLGVLFVVVTYRLGDAPTPAAAMRVFSYSISYVTLIGVAITVDVLVR
jgi:protoheme IX farnesyltransferase